MASCRSRSIHCLRGWLALDTSSSSRLSVRCFHHHHHHQARFHFNLLSSTSSSSSPSSLSSTVFQRHLFTSSFRSSNSKSSPSDEAAAASSEDDGAKSKSIETSSSPEKSATSSSASSAPEKEVPASSATTTTTASSESIRVKPKVKSPSATSLSPTVGRNFVTTTRAMREYALDIADLGDLRKFQRRSPYNNEPPITVYLRKDVEAKALEIWGTWERLNGELQKRKEKEENYSESLLIVKKYNKDYRRLNTPEAKQREDTMRESGRVVLAAVAINGANFVLKLFGWLYTGSHSLFAEAIHSLADTCNQIILAFGIRKSLQVPNKEHPYGYHPMRYIAALISGVGIFCTGTGVSLYHGVHGLLHLAEAAPDTSYYWAFLLLLGSLISEGGTLVIALQAASRAARQQNLPLKRYILRGDDPTLNVVILEDAAAVLGVLIAGSCMGLTSFYGMPVFDAVGSLAIGGLLGGVASFVIVSNAGALVGKSIAPASLATINRCLEADEMVRAIHDVKATNMGNEVIRYKAEVDFDGRKLTRNYLDSVDLVALQQELKEVAEAGENGNLESVEEFMLKHGENIVDLLGAEVDRIENELKRKHPQVRHVDLEVL